MILVNGTDHDSLKKGPGRDLRTYMPGEGQLIYIAGHRTTYLAPFAHIDSMRRGDLVTLEVPYATFVYRVFRKKIAPSADLAVLHSRGRDVVALQACHPRFFATNRYIGWGRLLRIEPPGPAAVTPPPTRPAAPRPAAAQGGRARRTAAAERRRLARLGGDARRDLFDSELGRDPAHEVVRANGDPARGHEHVGLEPARKGLAMGILVVGHDRRALRNRARRPELSREDQPVRLVDLARTELLAR